MKKSGLLFFFFIITQQLWAQTPKVVAPVPSKTDTAINRENRLYLVQSEYATGFQDKDLMYVIKPVFKQGNAILTCDSANYYPSRAYFDAFGNVHIIHADTTNIYSDKLEYDGKTKQAYLTQNVQLVNPSSTLSTDVLLYNLGTKLGTYTNGGTLENKSVTINSKNGYYFGNTQDVYFRYNVVAKTQQSTIKSDTLRFNSNTNTAFFYGPTNIYGKDDQLYTENGTYNTKMEQAFFGKNNLYNQGSKYLKGDSLFYDAKAGYGKAIRNIKFLDTVERIEMYGQQGYFYKKNKFTLVTDRAFLVMATKDTVKTKQGTTVDSIWMTADTLSTQMVLKESIKPVARIVVKSDSQLVEESDASASASGDPSLLVEMPKNPKGKKGSDLLLKKNKNASPKDSLATNTLIDHKLPKQIDSLKDSLPQKIIDTTKVLPVIDSLKKATNAKKSHKLFGSFKSIFKNKNAKKSTSNLDSLQDSLKKKVKLPAALAKQADSLKKDLQTRLKNTKGFDSLKTGLDSISKLDSIPGVKDTSEISKLGIKLKIPENLKWSKNKNVDYGTVKRGGNVDSLGNFKANNEEEIVPDSLQARIINAHHHVKIFKSDVQTKADSIYYNSLDSTIRCFINPIIWSSKSQITGDTLFIQLKNNKLSAIQAFKNGYMSQVEERDTLKFNQTKGREMTGIFSKGQLSDFYVDGNAESIYFVKKDSTTFSGMNQTVSSRIKIDFRKGKVFKVTPIGNVDGKMFPMTKLPGTLEMKGFSWKPKERPASKESIIPKQLPATATEKIKPKKLSAKGKRPKKIGI